MIALLLALLAKPFVVLIRHLRRLDLNRGSVEMSDAKLIFEQAQQMREELTARVRHLEARVSELDREISELRTNYGLSLAREEMLRGEVARLTNSLKGA